MALAMIFFSAGVSSRWPSRAGGGAPSSLSISGDDEDEGGGDGDGDEVAQAPSARSAANATINPHLICRFAGRDSCLSLLCIISLDVTNREQSAASIAVDEVAAAICDARPEGTNVGRMFACDADSAECGIFATLVPDRRLASQSSVLAAVLAIVVGQVPAAPDGHGAKISSTVWLFRTRGPRQRPVCVMRHVEGWHCKEETCSGTGRGAFGPEHRRPPMVTKG